MKKARDNIFLFDGFTEEQLKRLIKILQKALKNKKGGGISSD